MQKIEKWRIQEMALVLNRFAELLIEGQNREWGNVFSHFFQEAMIIIQKTELDLDSLKRLILSIKGCFDRASSLRGLILHLDHPSSSEKLNQEFVEERVRLQKILLDLEERTKQLIH
jgi:hypothetical protein